MSNKYFLLFLLSLITIYAQASEHSFQKGVLSSSVKLIGTKKASQYSNMFKLEEKSLTLQIVGMQGSNLSVEGAISYYHAKIPNSEMVVTHLVGLDMEKSSAESIATLLAEGVKSSEQCVGNRSTCLVSSIKVQFVVDYYNAVVRVFPTSAMFKNTQAEIRLTPTENEGLISQFYGNVSHMDETQYYVNSDNVLGLGKGYVSSSTRLNEKQTVLEDLYYTYDGSGFTSSIGLMEGNQSLGIASQGNLIDGDYVGYAFSNKDALKLRNLSGRSINFFSSIEGDYEVLKDGEVVHRGFARSGENNIPYSRLPSGSYKITIQVKHQEKMLVIGEDYVSNISNYEAGETSYYFRAGWMQNYGLDQREAFFADSGISIPLSDTSSVIGNLAFVEDTVFIGGGVYANLLNSNLSANAYVSDDQVQANFGLYSGAFNLNGSYNVDHSGDYLEVRESASIFAGLSQRFGSFNLNLNVGYTNNDDSEYTSYNLGVGYFSPKGWSLQANLTNPYDEDQVQMVMNIPFSFGLSNSLSAITHNKGVKWRNAITGNYAFNDELNISGTANTDFSAGQSSETDVRLGANYNTDYLSASASVSKVGDTKGFSGSLSTTAYVTHDGVGFQNALENQNTFIEVRSKDGRPIKGRIKLKDSLSLFTEEVSVDSNETIKIQDYSRKKLSYEFDSYEYRLIDASMESGVELDFTPGKVHQLLVEQQPIGNVLVVWNPAVSVAPICEGDGCLEQQQINEHVSRFMVVPDLNVSIKGGATMCFDGSVKQGETKKGVCKP
ncbi:hypothetical protein DR996_00415 [Vibrio owensii]|nr:hypothetical protein DR996_00415 [Vibrio owensii]